MLGYFLWADLPLITVNVSKNGWRVSAGSFWPHQDQDRGPSHCDKSLMLLDWESVSWLFWSGWVSFFKLHEEVRMTLWVWWLQAVTVPLSVVAAVSSPPTSTHTWGVHILISRTCEWCVTLHSNRECRLQTEWRLLLSRLQGDYSGLPRCALGIHQGPGIRRGGQKNERQRDGIWRNKEWIWLDRSLLASKEVEGARSQRVWPPLEAAEDKEMVSPRSLQKETQFCQHLDFGRVGSPSDFWTLIYFCVKPLNLWRLVIAGNEYTEHPA